MNRQRHGWRALRHAQRGLSAKIKWCAASRRAQFEPVCIAVMGMACVTTHTMAISAVGAPPPVIDSIDPGEVIEKPVPQPAFKVFGQNLRQPGVFDASGNPTITIEHTELKGVSFSAVASTNFAGTEATIPAGLNHFNMLQMPLGVYDVTLTRPDGQSATVPDGFAMIEEPPLDLEPGEIKMTIASHWGGPVTGADVHGDYAYLANGRRLVIVDISDESNPIEVGSISALMPGYPRRVRDVKVRDGYAYVLSGGNVVRYLSVVDVSNPASPELMWVGTASTGSIGAATSVCLDGDYAYTSGEATSRKFDISDPLKVMALGETDETCDPEPMPEIDGWHSPAELTFMVKSGDLLFVADRWSGFTILDVSDLSQPLANSVVSIYTHQPYENYIGEVMGLAIDGNRAYLTLRQLGLEIVDISDPANPKFLNAFRPTSFDFGDHSCVFDGGGFCEPDTCAECAGHAPNLDCSYFTSMAVQSGLAHIGAFLSTCSPAFACDDDLKCGGNYFVTIDVSDPMNLSQFNALQIDCCGSPFTRIALGEPDAAFAAGSVFSSFSGKERYFGAISSQAPVLLADVPPQSTTDIVWKNETVFVTRRNNPLNQVGLFIRDVSNASNPVLLAHIDVDGASHFATDAQDSRIYTAHNTRAGVNFSLYDVVNPIDPALIDAINIGAMNESGMHHILAAEPHVFVTNAGSSSNLPYGLTMLTVHGIEPTCATSDLNCDGVVDGADLLILLGAWGNCADPEDCPADLNGDGVVDGADLLILLSNWG